MEDRCVSCGNIVPEGTWVCPTCQLANGQPPCFTCTERAVECHIFCRKYLMYHKATQAKGDIKLQQSGANEYFAKKARKKAYNKLARNKKEECR